MKVFCYIPSVVLTTGESSSQIRSLLSKAFTDGVTPTGLPPNVKKLAVTLDTTHRSRLAELCETHNLAPGRVVGGLLYAQYLSGQRTGSGGAVPVPVLMGLRASQVQCLQEAAPMMRAGQIILAECGTGSGKGRIIAHGAAHALALRNAGLLTAPEPVNITAVAPGLLPVFIRTHALQAQKVQIERRRGSEPRLGPVIICAPSIENVAHLVREWSACKKNFAPDLGACAVALGRGQFVNPSHLAQMLEEFPDHPQIRAWLDAGMPAGLTQATQRLKEVEPRLSGLMDDLEFLAQQSDFDYADARLDEDADLEDEATYRELRWLADTADVIFTTHAMFCLDNLLLISTERGSLLPAPCAVFVDEAHQLESSQARMASKSLSFVRLLQSLNSDVWAGLRQHTAAQAAIAMAKQVSEALREVADATAIPVREDTEDAATWRAWQQAQRHLAELKNKIQAIIAGADKKQLALSRPQASAVRYLRQTASVLTSLAEGYAGHLEFSPVLRRLTFNVGPNSVEKHLAARWETTPTAVLLSGTLMHISINGRDASAFAREVASDALRTAATTPLHPVWITSTPTLHLPSPRCFHSLVPPKSDDTNPLSLAFWLANCAKVISQAAQAAAGGTLILMTGYDRLEMLAGVLAEQHPALQGRLIVQSRQKRVSGCASQFKDMARAGSRPVWLATGAAWTGLDLADDRLDDSQAAQDNLLTDLIIPAMPFGLDKTTTHVARVSRLGFGLESRATQRRLRQALGRLVRRDGLLNRKIWILDGRLQHPGAVGYTNDLNRVLLQYLHKRTFEL
jgi:ATP-dependent DNA helicase DinG